MIGTIKRVVLRQPKPLGSILKSFQRTHDALEKLESHHIDQTLVKIEESDKLRAEADAHRNESSRAYRVRVKIAEFAEFAP